MINLTKTLLTEEERNNYIEWCLLFNGYSRAYYDKFSDQKLIEEYERLVPVEDES